MPDRARRYRAAVSERAGGRCEYCRSPASFSCSSFSLDHIIPSSRGGQTSLRNLAFSCGGCNGRKYIKTHFLDLQTDRIVPLFNPRKQAWKDHFRWSTDAIRVEALTDVGRATISALELNRAELKDQRRLLILAGEHPPSEE